MKVVLVFLDGVGIGPDDPDRNPFLRADMPRLRRALGGIPTLEEPRLTGPGGRSLPLDANLGLEGTPQSGTGQTSLLTGVNTAEIFGRHFGPWTPVKLRPLLEEQNLLSRALELGLDAAFANAYPRGWPHGRAARFPAAPPLAARAAGLLTRDHEELIRGDAVASGIVNDGWRMELGFREVPEIGAREAGSNLARIGGSHHVTLYAHYATDHAGHREGMDGAVEALERVDAFLGGLLDDLEPGTVALVASDHGNIEDMTEQHTRNPVMGLVLGDGEAEGHGEDPEPDADSNGLGSGGPAAAQVELRSILDVVPWIFRCLEAGR